MKTPDFIKIVLPLKDNGTETVWATQNRHNTYTVKSIPFFAYGVSFNDMIATTTGNGLIFIDKIVKKSGHKTVRCMLAENKFDEHIHAAIFEKLNKLGCSFEGFDHVFWAIDIPPAVKEADVVNYLNTMKLEWEFGDPEPEQ